jgi:hypothetical protein
VPPRPLLKNDFVRRVLARPGCRDQRLPVVVALECLGVAPRTLITWIKAGKVTGTRIGKRGWWHIPTSEVERLREELGITKVG